MAWSWGGAGGGAVAGSVAGPAGTVAGGLLGGLFGGKKKKGDNKGLEWIQKPAYTGQRPYSGAEVGYGSKEMQDLASAYLPELKRRAMGEGQVGFQPEWYETRKRQGLGDLKEQYDEGRDVRSAQASGQGLRGGIPVSIERQAQEDYGDTTADFLDKLSIADLEARRADINKAFYQQPEEITRGAGIQNTRANFDLNEYNSTMPILYEYPEEESNPLGSMLSMGGQFLGDSSNGQNTLARAMQILNSSSNKSMNPQKTLADYRAEARRY